MFTDCAINSLSLYPLKWLGKNLLFLTKTKEPRVSRLPYSKSMLTSVDWISYHPLSNHFSHIYAACGIRQTHVSMCASDLFDVRCALAPCIMAIHIPTKCSKDRWNVTQTEPLRNFYVSLRHRVRFASITDSLKMKMLIITFIFEFTVKSQ